MSTECIEKIYSSGMCKEGIGLVNVHTRLRLLYGQGLEIRSTNEGTTIFFRIPREVS